MEHPKINLAILEKYLSTVVNPEDLAKQLDDLAYYFSQTVAWLHNQHSDTWHVHEDSQQFIYRLKQLRDIFQQSVNEKQQNNLDFLF